MSTQVEVFDPKSIHDFLGFIREMSEQDPSFKSALDRVILGKEDSDEVIAEVLCNGDMKEIVQANMEAGEIAEALGDVKIYNQFMIMKQQIEQLEKDEA